MALRKAATVGMPTSHGVPVLLPVPPTTVSTPDGRGLVPIGSVQIGPHFVGDVLHAPNAVVVGGSLFVQVDGRPVAFVGDSFQ